MSALLLFVIAVSMGMVRAPPPGDREQGNSIESMRSNADPLERPVHLDGLLLERDGELNKEFRQEVLLGGGKPKDSAELREMVKKMFYETDQNNDGALSLEELEERIINNTRTHLEEAVMEAQSHFNIVDTNKDGQISWQEYEPHYLSNEAPKDGHEHETVDNIDSVADAVRAFESADLDKDGVLDSKEWLRFFHPEHHGDSLKEMAGDILKLHDANGDGKMTREEFSAGPKSENEDDEEPDSRRKAKREFEFDKQIDVNGDGVATIEEIFEYINPRNARSLAAEATELIDSIDSDGDRKLTLDELLKQDRLVEFSPLLSVAETLHEDL
ncbi:hypothetical protein V3C99_013118 [Haemonchus contortus]